MVDFNLDELEFEEFEESDTKVIKNQPETTYAIKDNADNGNILENKRNEDLINGVDEKVIVSNELVDTFEKNDLSKNELPLNQIGKIELKDQAENLGENTENNQIINSDLLVAPINDIVNNIYENKQLSDVIEHENNQKIEKEIQIINFGENEDYSDKKNFVGNEFNNQQNVEINEKYFENSVISQNLKSEHIDNLNSEINSELVAKQINEEVNENPQFDKNCEEEITTVSQEITTEIKDSDTQQKIEVDTNQIQSDFENMKISQPNDNNLIKEEEKFEENKANVDEVIESYNNDEKKVNIDTSENNNDQEINSLEFDKIHVKKDENNENEDTIQKIELNSGQIKHVIENNQEEIFFEDLTNKNIVNVQIDPAILQEETPRIGNEILENTLVEKEHAESEKSENQNLDKLPIEIKTDHENNQESNQFSEVLTTTLPENQIEKEGVSAEGDFEKIKQKESDNFDFSKSDPEKNDEINEIPIVDNQNQVKIKDDSAPVNEFDDFEFEEFNGETEQAKTETINIESQKNSELPITEESKNNNNSEMIINTEIKDQVNLIQDSEVKSEEPKNDVVEDKAKQDNQFDDFEFEEFNEFEEKNDQDQTKEKVQNQNPINDKKIDDLEDLEFEDFDDKTTNIDNPQTNSIPIIQTEALNHLKGQFGTLYENLKTKINNEYYCNEFENKENQEKSEFLNDYSIELAKNSFNLSYFKENSVKFGFIPKINFKKIEISEIVKNQKSNKHHFFNRYQNSEFYNLLNQLDGTNLFRIYHKLTDLGNLYDNLFLKKSKKIFKQENEISNNNQVDVEFKEDNIIDADKNMEIALNNLISNIENKKNDENDFEDEFEDHITSNKTKLPENKVNNDINNVLFSLVIDNKEVVSHMKDSKIENIETTNEVKPEEIKVSYDENNILEMLKNFGIKYNESTPQIEVKKENDELVKFIDSLPNYSFMTSKNVEFPFSFFG